MKNYTYFVRLLCLCVFLSGSFVPAFSQQVEKNITSSSGDLLGFLQYTPTDYNQNSNKYPLIIFLHGIGERGNGTTDLHNVSCCGLPRIIKLGHKMTFTWNGKKETFLVISPQCPKKYGMWPSHFVDDLITYAKKNLRIDTDRIFLTGLSMGGGGTLRYISHNAVNPTRLAAAATISAPCFIEDGTNVAKANLPVWSFHAKDDSIAKAKCTDAAIASINSGNPAVVPLKTIWPQGGHLVWDRVYTDTSYQYDGILNIYEWFLGQKKNAAPNKLPVANAGPDLEVSAADGLAQLNASASTDADGKLVRFVWKKLSGPAAGVIASPFGPASSTSITGLTIAGTYKYQLAVVDDRASFDKDTLTITVSSSSNVSNKVPVAKAGTDIVIGLPTNTINLDGSASADPDGTIASYAWTKVSGPAATIAAASSAKTAISNLAEGTYSFKLVVTDNKGLKAEDLITVTVNPAPSAANKAPVAQAGDDIVITLPLNSVMLNGTATDQDGTITAYLWTRISGPAQYNLAAPTTASTKLSNLVQGSYVLRLKVTDNKGATHEDLITITVKVPVVPPNILPVSKAGSDFVITLPTNKINLNGNASSDQDGTIVSYSWIRISGPAHFIIANINSANTLVSNLSEGVYLFALRVTDNRGGANTDTMKVTVNPAPAPVNIAPIAQAGSNHSITLPVNTTSLNGSASSDADGSVTAFRWSYISGPEAYSFQDSASVITNVSGLTEGTYLFRLSVKDNKGATDADTIRVTVNADTSQELVINKVPSAKAGNPLTITLPQDQATLNGSTSDDTDGTIVGYQWSRISGPDQYTIVDPSSSVTIVENLVEGIYYFKLEVKDNDGATSQDTITLTVNAAPNALPVADAGNDIVVYLPDPSIQLNGLGSNDPEGNIASYRWARISGAGAITIINSTTATPTVIGVTPGEYLFELTVTDENGAEATDQVKVTVISSENFHPLAAAGDDQSLASPENTALLNGSDSYDQDGWLVKYSWKQLNGPSVAAILTPDDVITEIAGLEIGEYVFELTVTDEKGSISVDKMTLAVLSNLRFEQKLGVFPNPARSDINVQFMSDTTGKVKINIYGVNGAAVKTIEAEKTGVDFRQNIYISNLQTGLYYVEILVGNKQRMITKFIKH